MSLVINSWQNREKSKHKISTTLVGVCESENFVDVIYMRHMLMRVLQGGSSARGQAFVDIEMRLAFYYCKLIL